MKQIYSSVLALTITMIANLSAAFAQNNGWITVGPTQSGSPYNLYYYKLLQINSSSHRYATTIEVSVQADANYYHMQGTYRIRVDKYENTAGRFDGLEIQCISGNPNAASFYVYNNALWLCSNYQWGYIYYRIDGDFTGYSPLNTAPFGQTTTAPAGYAAATGNGSLKCDFDNNRYYPLSYLGIYGGGAFFSDIGIQPNVSMGVNLGERFNYDGKTSPQYGLQWISDSWNASEPTFWLGARGGMKFFTQGVPQLTISGVGNVGIGTADTKGYKFAVAGSMIAEKMRVKVQSAWPDYVFTEAYKLPTLKEVEDYIKVNGHLPEMPTAEEVKEEGVDVGEMNRRLVKKVEELMLYIIKLDKQNQELREGMEELRKSIR